MISIIVSILILASFIWLGYETDWMRVRLLVGAPDRRKWQFLKYGEKSLTLCLQCRNRCHPFNDKHLWFGWTIPARTVKVFGSTINFKEGCNGYRAKLLKNIIKAQKSKAMPTYHKKDASSYVYNGKYNKAWFNTSLKPSIELLVDGKSVANISSDYKRGMIRKALKAYKVGVGV